MTKKEEQIISPDLDTPLGQAGDELAKAVANLKKAEKDIDSAKKKVLKEMKESALDHCRIKGDDVWINVRTEVVKVHDKLKYSISAIREESEDE